jgi:hypothetical protein
MCNVTIVAVAVFVTFWMFENIKSPLIIFFYVDIYSTWNEYSPGYKSEKLIHS